jgi:hypothetical protein
MADHCAVCHRDWRMPFTHRDCVESLGEKLYLAQEDQIALGWKLDALQTRVAELEHEDQIKTDADVACAVAAEAEIDRLQARVAALQAHQRVTPNDLDPSLLGDTGVGCLVLVGLVVLGSLGLLFWWLQR